ncbi:GIY-YIG nuclease family protein [Bacillus pacificus]|uniref:GIY-YIG nuclease family protein n=1 Tax=Bacillus TaxID=1386 RepID=UPI002FF14C8D
MKEIFFVGLTDKEHWPKIRNDDRFFDYRFKFTYEEYDWSYKTGKNKYPRRHGVYALMDNDHSILYIGSSTAKNGLQERHFKHEREDDFKLFGAKKIIFYFVTDDTPDEILLLERYMICAYGPELNRDIKMGNFYVEQSSDQMLKNIDEMIKFYSADASKNEKRHNFKKIYDKLKVLQKNMKDADKEHKELLKKRDEEPDKQEFNKNLKYLNKLAVDSYTKCKEHIKNNIQFVNKEYVEYEKDSNK